MGRQQFENVVAQVPQKKIKTYQIDKAVTMNPYAHHTEVFYSSPNTESRVLGLYMYFQPNTGNNDHLVIVGADNLVSGGPQNLSVLYGRATFDSALQFNYGRFDDTVYETKPTTEIAQMQAMQGIVFTDVNGLQVDYTTFSDNAFDTYVEIDLIVEETEIKGG